MKRLEIDQDNYLVYRDTPWETRNLGLKTAEIMEVKYQNDVRAAELIEMFDKQSLNNAKELVCVRIDGDDKGLKKVLQAKGFYFAETSLLLALNNLGKIRFDGQLKLEAPNESDYEKIKAIASSAFNYGRFLEDPNIKNTLARERFAYMVDDLRKENKKYLVYKDDGGVQSFLAYEGNNDGVELILAGSAKPKGYLTYYFFSSFMKYFQAQGYKKVKTLISASNVSIINIYSALQFEVKKTMHGFHKLYKGNL